MDERNLKLRAEVVMRSNAFLDASKVVGSDPHMEAMVQLVDLIANREGALDLLRDLQPDKTSIVRLSPKARKLVSRAVSLGMNPEDVRDRVKLTHEKGRVRITKGDLKELDSEVNSMRSRRMELRQLLLFPNLAVV